MSNRVLCGVNLDFYQSFLSNSEKGKKLNKILFLRQIIPEMRIK
jgi:hypothetical protein